MIPRRSGRKTKKPEIFQPTEKDLVDDFSPDDHDTDFDSDIDTEEECYSDESDLDDDSDADEDGNLKGFIVDDESESEDA
jgi:hypothetical protein|tara:strand:+ start:3609 stop:3848 length:240 start_codon:yes stop_codon:yes gene_type:complete